MDSNFLPTMQTSNMHTHIYNGRVDKQNEQINDWINK